MALGILVGAMFLFASEIVSVDIGALIVLLALVLTGVLTPEEAVQGFANPAFLTVGAMFVLSAGLLRTGALTALSERVMVLSRGSERRLTLLLMVTVAVCSAFVNNTPVVVIFLPMVLSIANRSSILPSKVLIPLSYGAILGGTCTLMGTSTNILISSMVAGEGMRPLGVFEFTGMGVLFAIVGITYIYFIGRRFLPSHGTVTTYGSGRLKEYLTEIEVPEGSPLCDRWADEVVADYASRVQVFQIIRGEEIFWPPFAELRIRPGDAFLVKGEVNPLMNLIQSPEVALSPGVGGSDADAGNLREMALAELVISPNSPLMGESLRNIRFPERYGVQALAIQRHGSHLREKVSEIPLRVGDVLLVLGGEAALNRLGAAPEFILLEEVREVMVNRKRSWVALTVLGMVVLLAATNVLSILTAALAGAVVMVLTGCLVAREAYRAIDKSVLVLIAGSLSLGTALEKTGAASLLADRLVDLVGWGGPVAVLSGFYLLTVLLTEVMTNTAAAAVMLPIAVSTAAGLDVNPRSFIVAILFGASASFATPIGYQTNTFVYGPGGYSFTDFIRVGLPLQLTLWLLASLVIPILWPL
jgi:di/tricarboxylate transporter